MANHNNGQYNKGRAFYYFNLFVWLKVLEGPMLVPLETYPRGPRVDIRDRGQKGEDPLWAS